MKTTKATAVSLRTNRKNRKSTLRRGILAASIGALVGLAAPLASQAATFTYDDGGGNFGWSDAGNWNPNGAPVNGSDLVFSVHTIGGLTQTASNDLLTNVQSITYGGQSFLLNGNAITLGAGGITNNSANTQAISFGGTGITLGASQAWTAANGALNVTSNVALGANTLTVAGAQNTALSGTISGAGGNITKNGTGTLTITGTNSYSGPTNINAGTVSINNGSALGTGNVSVNSGGSLLGTANLTLANPNIALANGSTTSAAAGTTLTLSAPFLSMGFGGAVGGTVVFGSTGNTGVVAVGLPTSASAQNQPSNIQIAFGTLRNLGGAGNGLSFFTGFLNSTTVDAGATFDVNDISISVKNLLGAGNVTLGANAATTLGLDSGNFTGVISGAGGVIATGFVGSTTLGGINTYTGATQVTGGSLIAGSTQAFGVNSATTVGASSILELGGFSNTIGSLAGGGAGSFVQNTLVGPATLTIAGTNVAPTDYSGGIREAGGTQLSLIKNGAGTQIFSGAGANTYTGPTNVNDGNLILNGASGANNKITGNLIIGDNIGAASSAVVTLGNNGQIATASNMTINADGQFNMAGFGELFNDLTIKSGNVANVPISGGFNDLGVNGNLNMTGGSINGGTGVTNGLSLFGAGTSVTATSDAGGNAATINSNVTLFGVTRTFTVNRGLGALDLVINGVVQDSGAAAGITKQGAGFMQLAGLNTYGNAGTGVTNVNGGQLIVSQSTVGTFSSLGFGDNTAANGTQVNAGAKLVMVNGTSITNEFLTLNNGGQLVSQTPGGTVTWGGTILITGAPGTIDANGGTVNTGSINKTDVNLILTDSQNSAPGGAVINVNGAITGNAVGFNDDLLVTGVTANLNAANTYLGPTFITSTNAGGGNGVLNANVANALPIANGRTSVTMDVGGTGGSVLNIGGIPAFPGGANQAIASLAGAASSKVTLGNNTLTIGFGSVPNVNGTANAVFAGTISGTAPGFALIKDDVSTQILTGINTYIGFTAVNGGTLQVGDGVTAFSQLGTGQVFVNPTARLDIRLANGGIFANTVNTSGTGVNISTVRGSNTAGTTQRITGDINGTARFIQDGGGTSVFENVNTYQGGTQILNASTIVVGTLTAGATAGQNISTNTIVVANGSTLNLVNVSGSTLNNNITNGVGGAGAVTATSTFATVLTGTLTDGAAGTLSLTQNGSGTTFLVNAGNTYTGATTVLQGTLQVGTAGLVGSVGSQAAPTAIVIGTGGTLTIVNTVGNALANNVTNGVGGAGTLIVNSANTNTLSGALTNGAAGTLALTQSGSGTTILTSAGNTYTGATTVSSGTLQLGTAALQGSIGAANVNLGTGGTLAVVNVGPTPANLGNNIQNNLGGTGLVNNSSTAGVAFSGNILDGVGSLAFTQSGTGASYLTGTNTYSGVTNITAGTLFAGSSTALGTAAGGTVVAAGATLDLFGQNIAAEAVQIQGTGDALGLGYGVPQIAALSNTGGAATLGGVVTMAASASIGSNGGDITLTNTLSGGGAAALTKVGTDTLTLNGVNDYNGTTTVAAGILVAGNASALGNTGAGTTVANGAALLIANGINVIAEPLTINGNGTGAAAPGALTVAAGGTASFAGPITVATNSTINANGGALTLTGPINKTGVNLTLAGVGGAGSSITVNGVISGNTGVLNSDLIVNGTTVNLNAANTYLGQTFITSIAAGDGIVNANVASALPTTPVRTQLIMDGAFAGLVPVLAGAGGSVLNLGASQSVASLTGDVSSIINLAANTLTIGFGTANVNGGYTNSNFAGVINGTGGLTKDEISTQVLSGLNTYTGATLVSGGTLQAGISDAGGLGATTNGAFGNKSAVTVNTPGVLEINGFAVGIGSLAGTGTVQNSSALLLGTLTTGGDNTSTNFSGVLQDTAAGGIFGGFALWKVGTGTQTLSGAAANTYTGITWVKAGELDLNKTAGVDAIGVGNLFVGDGVGGGANSDIVKLLASNQINNGTSVFIDGTTGKLDLNNFNETILVLSDAGVVTPNGSSVNLGTGTLTFGDGTNNTFSGAITGVAASPLDLVLIKNGTGTQTLAGTTTANTFTGTTVVNAGELDLAKTAGTQAIGGHMTIGDGAGGANSDIVKLLASNQIIDTSRISINGSSGRLDINGFTETIAWFADTGAVAVNGSSVDLGVGGTLTYGNASNQTFSGAITGTGNIFKVGTGTQTLAGTVTANTFSGLTTVNAGEIDLNKTAGTLAIGGNLNIGDGAGPGVVPTANSDIVKLLASNQIIDTAVVQINATTGRFDLNNFSETVGSIASTGAFTLGGSTINLGSGTLTTGGLNTSTTYSGVIGGAGGGLTKAGTGTFTLSGLNTYTGATNVTGGTLKAASTQAFGLNSAVTVAAAATLDLAGNSNSIGSLAGAAGGTVQSTVGPATLTTGGDNTSTAFAGVVQDGVGPLSLVKNGTGTQTLSGVNTYTGTTTVNGGSLLAGSTSAYGVNSAVTVNAGGTLDLGGFGNSIGSLSGVAGGTVQNSTGTAATLTTGGLNTTTAFGGTIQNGAGAPLALVKNGTGLQVLSGTNSYTGGTTLNAGILGAASTKAFGSGNLTVNGGILRTVGGPLIVNLGAGNLLQTGGAAVFNVGGTTPGVTHDQILTTGTANRTGGVLTLVQQGGYTIAPGDKINLVSAAGGVAGGTALGAAVPNASVLGLSAFSDTPLLVPIVNLYPKTVTLEVELGSFKGVNGQTFSGGFGSGGGFRGLLSLTPNELAVAGALDSVVSLINRKTGVFKELDFLAAQPLRTLLGNLDEIAPEELTSIFTQSVSLANIQTANLQRRMEDIRSQATAPSAAGLAAAGSGPRYSGGLAGPAGRRSKEIMPPNEDRWGTFLIGSGEFTHVGSTSNAAGYKLETGGITGGLDYRVSEHFAMGLSFGYVGTTAQLVNNGKIDTDGGRLGLYATYFNQGFYVDAAVTGGLNSYSTRRTTPTSAAATGSPDGSEVNALIATGYDWKVGGWTVGPTASYQYTNVHLDRFTETGSFIPLTVDGQSEESSRTALGLRAYYDAKIGGVTVRPEARFSWQHEFGDAAYSLTSRFVSLGGNGFTVSGPVTGRDSLLLGAGITVLWNDRFAIYVNYDGELGRSKYDSHNISGGFRLQF